LSNDYGIYGKSCLLYLDCRPNFNKPACIQIEFLYAFMPRCLHMIHNIATKREGSSAIRTYPNIVQIFWMHVNIARCITAANSI